MLEATMSSPVSAMTSADSLLALLVVMTAGLLLPVYCSRPLGGVPPPPTLIPPPSPPPPHAVRAPIRKAAAVPAKYREISIPPPGRNLPPGGPVFHRARLSSVDEDPRR